MKEKYKSMATSIAVVGISAAILECGKIALSFLPNVEVVTLFVALFGYVFGPLGVLGTVVFCCIEPLIYGFGSWVVTYFIYWPTLAAVFMLLSRAKIKGRWILTAVAVGLTLLFGVLSALIDVVFYLGINEYYFKNLLVYYVRGIGFYLVQTVANAVLFPILFELLSKKLKIIKQNMRI